MSCPSSLYFTQVNGACTSSCVSPYKANVQTKTCEPQINDASAFATFYTPILDSTFSASSTLSTEAKANVLNAFSVALQGFYSDNYGLNNDSSSSTCTTCSGNGVCQDSPLYLKKLCTCDSGWTGDNCAISSVDATTLEELKILAISKIVFSSMQLTTTAVYSGSYLEALSTLTDASYCSDNAAQAGLQSISSLINYDYSYKATTDIFDHAKLLLATQIIDSCMFCIYKSDCLLQDSISQSIYSNGVELMSKLAVLQLWQKAADSGIFTLDSTHLQILSARVSVSKLDGFTVAPPNSPKIVFQNPGTSNYSSEAVDILMTMWKTNLMICPGVSSNTPPPVTVAVNTPNTLTSAPIASQLSAKVSFPITSSTPSYTTCSPGCTSTVAGGFLECSCAQVASLSNSNQMKSFFAQSNVYKLAMASSLTTFDYLGAWSFWILCVLGAWTILTIFMIKARICKPLRFTTNNKSGDKKGSKDVIKRTTLHQKLNEMSFFKALFKGILVNFIFFLLLS